MATARIAIVEDEMAIQDMYKFRLEQAGYSVRTAADGSSGLHMIEGFMPDLILLDLRMPVMSGDEMLMKLRATDWGSDMRVIVLTNISKSEAPHSLRFLHVDRYIVKVHCTPAQVVTIVKEVLG